MALASPNLLHELVATEMQASTVETVLSDFVEGSSAQCEVVELLFGEVGVAGATVSEDIRKVLDRMARSVVSSLALSISTLQASQLRKTSKLVSFFDLSVVITRST